MGVMFYAIYGTLFRCFFLQWLRPKTRFQEKEFEVTNEYIFALGSHVIYWSSKDVSLFVAQQVVADAIAAEGARGTAGVRVAAAAAAGAAAGATAGGTPPVGVISRSKSKTQRSQPEKGAI